MTNWTKNHRRSIVVICAVCTLLAICLHTFPTFQYGMMDLLIQKGRQAKPDPELMFLAIDSPTLNIGNTVFKDDLEKSPALKLMSKEWPWSREVYALVIERLVDAGAKVVAFDMLFPAPRPKAGDEEFRTMLDKYKDHVVIGSNFEELENVNGSKYAIPTYTPPATSLIPPPAEADDRVGYVNLWPMDKVNGVIRTARYRISGREYFHKDTRQVFESLAGRILRKSGHADAIPSGEAPFRFAAVGTGREFDRHSLYSIFLPRDWEGELQNGAIFKGKTVLIGTSGNAQKDVVLAPFGEVEGPLVHLSVVNAALHNDFYSISSFFEGIILILLGGGAALLLSLVVEMPLKRFSLILGGCFGYMLASKLIFDFGSHMPPVITPVVAFFGSGIAVFVKQVREERNERMRLRQKMERYVSKNVVKELMDNPSSFLNELGGVRKPVAILMTDLRNFTTLSESADSVQLVQQLNEYFTEMVRIIFEHQGTVDKFIGDAILAVWGNIHSEGPQRDAELAALAAMEMQEALIRLNLGWRERKMPELEMGIGINAGDVIFGNIGSNEKMEPTVIGDVVNITARLEGITKEYGVKIILGEKAAALVGGVCHLQIVDRIQLKGKTRMIQAYTSLGHRNAPLGDGMAKYMEIYKTGLVHYQGARFKEAGNAFALCLTFRENDALAQLYVARCVDLDRNPPEQWTGVYVMHSK